MLRSRSKMQISLMRGTAYHQSARLESIRASRQPSAAGPFSRAAILRSLHQPPSQPVHFVWTWYSIVLALLQGRKPIPTPGSLSR